MKNGCVCVQLQCEIVLVIWLNEKAVLLCFAWWQILWLDLQILLSISFYYWFLPSLPNIFFCFKLFANWILQFLRPVVSFSFPLMKSCNLQFLLRMCPVKLTFLLWIIFKVDSLFVFDCKGSFWNYPYDFNYVSSLSSCLKPNWFIL